MSDRLNTIADELLALRNPQGTINAVEAVKWARENPKSRLHSALEWNDELAAERYRVWQVRSLIAVHIVDPQGERRFVSLSIDRGTGGYRPMSEVIERPDLREIMLADALAELERLQKRYDRLSELSTVWAEAGKVAARRGRKPKAA